MKLKCKYVSPELETWNCNPGRGMLDSLSLKGNVGEISEGEELRPSTNW